MLSQLPSATLVRVFRTFGVRLRAVVMIVVVAFAMAVVVDVHFVKSTGLLPFMAFAGRCEEKQSGSGGGEKRGRFHPAAGLAVRAQLASGERIGVSLSPEPPPRNFGRSGRRIGRKRRHLRPKVGALVRIPA